MRASGCGRRLGHRSAGAVRCRAGTRRTGRRRSWRRRLLQPLRPAPASPATSSQPPLNVDRDPSPSPDPDPAPQPIGNTPQTPIGKIARAAGGKYTLRENAYEVRLNASVFDQTGRSVETLGKDAFHVYEDGVPQTIASFRHEDLPVSLGILIDSSGSMYDKRAAVDEASLDLVKLSNPEDEAFLVDFSYEAFIDQDFTNNINKLQQGLSYIKSSGGTAMYDALVASADYLSKNAKHPKQVLLVVTDGEDNASSATLEAAIRRIQEFDGPVIYSIGLLFGDDTNKGEVRTARRVLETLSEETGGQAYFPKIGEGGGCHRQRSGKRHPHAIHHCVSLHQVARTRRISPSARRGHGRRDTANSRCEPAPDIIRVLAIRHPRRPIRERLRRKGETGEVRNLERKRQQPGPDRGIDRNPEFQVFLAQTQRLLAGIPHGPGGIDGNGGAQRVEDAGGDAVEFVARASEGGDGSMARKIWLRPDSRVDSCGIWCAAQAAGEHGGEHIEHQRESGTFPIADGEGALGGFDGGGIGVSLPARS